MNDKMTINAAELPWFEGKPLVSILINNYNYGRYLSDAIDSALGQTYLNTEVIVVDDGSTDNSREVIEHYGDRIVAILKENGGQASAMNAGFAASKGEIICILDSDDLFLPEKVSEVVDLFQKNPGIDWVFTESAPVHAKESLGENLESIFEAVASKSRQDLPRIIDFKENIKKAELPHFAPSTSNLCFSRLILDKIFPLPEAKGLSKMAITDLYIKLLAIGLSTGCVTVKNLGIFRFHNNLYTTQSLEKKRRMFADIYLTTGYWMKVKFPDFSKLSNKIFSKGFGAYWATDAKDSDCEKIIQEHLANSSLSEKIEIGVMTLYCFMKSRFAKSI